MTTTIPFFFIIIIIIYSLTFTKLFYYIILGKGKLLKLNKLLKNWRQICRQMSEFS